jgi:hypothetical protein
VIIILSFSIPLLQLKKNSLEIDGRVEKDPSILSKYVVDFYKNLMGTSTNWMLKLQLDFWSISDKLTHLK